MGAFLSALGLKPSKAMLSGAATAAPPMREAAPAPGGTANPPAASPRAAKSPAAVPDDPALASAQALRKQLEARHKLVQGVYDQLAAGERKIADEIKKAPASSKPTLEAKRKQIEAALKKAGERLDEARTDLETVDKPGVTREELVKVLARARSKAEVEPLIDVESAPGITHQKLNERKQVTVETSYGDGVAKIERQEDSTTVDLEGVTKKQSKQTSWVGADGSVTAKEGQQLKVGPGGVSGEKSRAVEAVDAEGKKIAAEEKRSFEVGKDGAKVGKTVKVTTKDGSTEEVSGAAGVERGDGKLGVAGHASATTTDADGNELGSEVGGKGGLVAKDGAMGAWGGAEGGLSAKDKDGVKTGVVGGLHANMTCQIGDPKGEPPLYPVSIVISLGAEVKVSAGKEKEGAPGKAGASVSVGAELVIRETRHLDAKQVAKYIAAAEAAKTSGGKVDATYKELQILQAGVVHGWPVAQAMFRNGGHALSKDAIERLKNVGDSTEMATSRKVGAGLSGGVKAVSAELGASRQQDTSVKATRNEDKGLDVDAQASEQDKLSGKLGFQSGAVGMTLGASRTVKTTFGIEIAVAPDVPADDPLFAALVACSTQAHYEAFIARFKSKITVKGKLTGTLTAEDSTVGATIGGVGAEIGSGKSVDELRKVDAEGKLIEQTTTGKANIGGGIKLGEHTLGDSSTDEAIARTDAAGNSSLELKNTKKATSLDKLGDKLKAYLPGADEGEKKEASGLLTDAAGGKEDEGIEIVDETGLNLSTADLERIGRMAANNSTWMKAPRRHQELSDWEKAGAAIRAAGGAPAVVARELSKFVGGDEIHRRETLEAFLRPAGAVGIGQAYEFPESLKTRRKEYQELIVAACEAQVRKLAQEKGPKEADALGQQLAARVQALRKAVESAKDFSRKNAQAEMLSAITSRQTALATAIREVQGKNSAADERAAREEELRRLLESCQRHAALQDSLFERLEKMIDGRDRILTRYLVDAQPLVKQGKDLHTIWQRDLDAAAALARTHGLTMPADPAIRPNQDRFKKIRRACFESV